MSHKYKVGDRVAISVSSTGVRVGSVKIVQLLPAEREDLEPQYRVKSLSESHERVVQEGMIRSAD
jgi:hypothetical protein